MKWSHPQITGSTNIPTHLWMGLHHGSCATLLATLLFEKSFFFHFFFPSVHPSLVIIHTCPRAYEHQISGWLSLAPARRRWSSIRSSRIWAKYCAHSFWMAFQEAATAASPWVPSSLEGYLVRRAGTGGLPLRAARRRWSCSHSSRI